MAPSAEEVAAWYREHFAAARHLARRVCGDSHDGDDAVHDAFAAIAAGRVSYRGGDRRSWLLGVVYNHSRNRRRWRQRRREDQLAEAPSVAAPTADDALRSALREQLAELDERTRLALHLRYAENMSQGEIARVLGTATGTAASLLSRGRRRLAARLARFGPAVVLAAWWPDELPGSVVARPASSDEPTWQPPRQHARGAVVATGGAAALLVLVLVAIAWPSASTETPRASPPSAAAPPPRPEAAPISTYPRVAELAVRLPTRTLALRRWAPPPELQRRAVAAGGMGVVVLHPWGEGGVEDLIASHRTYAAAFVEAGWLVVGVIRSDDEPWLSAAGEDSAALLDQIATWPGVDVEAVVSLGASFGGMAALDLADRVPERILASVLVPGAWPPEHSGAPAAGLGPVLLIVNEGERDPWRRAVAATAASLRSAGVELELRRLPGDGHGVRVSARALVDWVEQRRAAQDHQDR